jgi:hypothetical protein
MKVARSLGRTRRPAMDDVFFSMVVGPNRSALARELSQVIGAVDQLAGPGKILKSQQEAGGRAVSAMTT